MALVSDLLVRAVCTETVVGDLQTSTAPLSYDARIKMATGVGTNLADLLFADTRTLTASSTENLDLNGGGLLTPLGQAFNIVKLKAIIVSAAAANTNDVQVIRPAANGVPLFAAASDQVNVRPGGVFALGRPDLGHHGDGGDRRPDHDHELRRWDLGHVQRDPGRHERLRGGGGDDLGSGLLHSGRAGRVRAHQR
jgi:hypothetical protein